MADEPCAPWLTVEELQACPSCEGVQATTEQLERALTLASAVLYRLSGRQFTGACSETIRPIADCECVGMSRLAGWVVIDSRTGIARSFGHGSWAHGRGREGVNEIPLGFYPVRSISQVRIDGAVFDPSSYRIDDFGWLVRTDGGAWPAGQDLQAAATEPNTFEVSLIWGELPTTDGLLACEVLASEFARAMCRDGSCRLPKRAQSIASQGVTVALLDPTSLTNEGRFGIDEIDWWLRTVNPENLQEPASILNVDQMRDFRRTGTTIA